MRISEISYEGLPPIDSYGNKGFRIADIFYAGSQIITPDGIEVLEYGTLESLSVGMIAGIIHQASQLDVVLIGTGHEIAPLPNDIRTAFEAANIGVELMKTASACRTYNILLSEQRRIAALLIAV